MIYVKALVHYRSTDTMQCAGNHEGAFHAEQGLQNQYRLVPEHHCLQRLLT